MKNSKAVAGLATTYITWSLYGVLSSAAKFGPAGVTVQAVVSFIAFFSYCKYKKIKLSWKEAKLSFAYSITRVISLGLAFYTYLILNVGLYNTIGACSIFILTGLFAPLEGEKFKKALIAPILVSVLGVGLVSGVVSTNGISDISPKYLFAFAGMIASTISIVLWRKCSLAMPSTNHITYMHGWTALMSVPLMYLLISTHSVSSNISPSFIQVTFLVLAAISGAAGDIVYCLIQKISTVTLNGLFVPSGALFGCLLGWIILGETLSAYQIYGVTVIILSVGVASYITSREPKEIMEVAYQAEFTSPVMVA